MSKVIFLDVDGVLNKHTKPGSTTEKTPMGFIGVDHRYLFWLSRLVAETGAEIVLSSDWKDCFKSEDIDLSKADDDGLYLVKRLADYGLKLTAKTDDRSVGDDFSTGRGYGIRKYLKAHPEIANYVILDDIHFSDFMDDLYEHFVYFQKAPLEEQGYQKALAILTKED